MKWNLLWSLPPVFIRSQKSWMDIGSNPHLMWDYCTHWVRFAVIWAKSWEPGSTWTWTFQATIPGHFPEFQQLPLKLSSDIFVVEDHIKHPLSLLFTRANKPSFFNLSLPIVSCRVLIILSFAGTFPAQMMKPQTGHDSSGVGPIMSHWRKAPALICEIWYNTELTTTRNSRLVGISKSKAMTHSFFLQIQSIYGPVSWNMMTYRFVVFFTQKRWAQCWQYIFFWNPWKHAEREVQNLTDTFVKNNLWFTTASKS